MNKAAQTHIPLEILQHWMQEVLINPFGEEAKPYALLPENVQDDIEKVILPSSRLSGRQRLAIYQRGYIARLRDCMAGQFRALRHALGEELFEAFADEYLQHYPSKSYTLGHLGQNFASFLEQTRPDRDAQPGQREDWPDFMIELAQLEYALLLIFDSAEIPGLKYAGLNAGDETLQLTQHLHLFAFSYPVNLYYQAVQRDDNPGLPPPQRSFMAVARKNYEIGVFNLNPTQYLFLQFLQQHGLLVPKALQVFAQTNNVSYDELKKVWQVWREKWLELGFFVQS